MLEFLKMTDLDAIWGVPFLWLLFITMRRLFEASSRVSIKKNSKTRKTLLERLKGNQRNDARRLIQCSKDPLIKAFRAPLIKCVDSINNDLELLKNNFKEKYSSMLREKIPHKEFLNSFCGDILSIGFFGTIIGAALSMIRFADEISEFSELFVYMGMAMKSSAFGIAASFFVSRRLVHLEQCLEKRRSIIYDFYSNLIDVISSAQRREVLKGGKQKRTSSNRVC